MGESKHTPGPWRISERRHPKNACVDIVAGEVDRDSVATLYYGDCGTKQDADGIWGDQPIREANARVIAAAPEMLETLKAFLNIAAHCEIKSGVCGCGEEMARHSDPYSAGHSPIDMADQVVSKAIADAEAVIAKAEGRS